MRWLNLVGFVVDDGGQVESHEGESGFPVLRFFKADDVLPALGSRLQRQAVAIAEVASVDVHLGTLVFFAGETFGGDRGCAHRGVPLAGDHIAIAAEAFFVEGCNLVLGVCRGVGDGAHAHLPLAKSHVHVGGLVVALVVDLLCAGIDRQAEVGSRHLVGVHMHSAKGRIDLHVLFLSVGILVDLDPAPGQKNGYGGRKGQAHCIVHCFRVHDERPLPLQYASRAVKVPRIVAHA